MFVPNHVTISQRSDVCVNFKNISAASSSRPRDLAILSLACHSRIDFRQVFASRSPKRSWITLGVFLAIAIILGWSLAALLHRTPVPSEHDGEVLFTLTDLRTASVGCEMFATRAGANR